MFKKNLCVDKNTLIGICIHFKFHLGGPTPSVDPRKRGQYVDIGRIGAIGRP